MSLALLFYFLCILLLLMYAGSSTYLLLLYLLHRRERPPLPTITDWPTVVVQLPIYNERYVALRLLDSVTRFHYPHERLTIQVLDDSTDDTSDNIAQRVDCLRAEGFHIQHIRRAARTGYKAGALADGLAQVNCEYSVIFDADFTPPPDFLCQTIPYLVANPRLGMVQTRWGHINPFDNALTWGQALALDGHFVVEQIARNRSGLLTNFNGSGGVWRTAAIQSAGGWQADTLTEDLDLSYRAQISGWEFLYLPDVVVPAELPPQIAAYKQQQARWSAGSTQALMQLVVPLWQGRLSLKQRIMGTMHLCQYLPHPLMIAVLLLTPPLLLARQFQHVPLMSLLGVVGLGPPLMYVISQYMLYPDWWRRLLAFPVLLALGTGIAWNNTRAIARAISGRSMEFRRTPKQGQRPHDNAYTLRSPSGLWVELGLALYAWWGVDLARRIYPALVPYLALYTFAFGLVALWTASDYWRQRHT